MTDTNRPTFDALPAYSVLMLVYHGDEPGPFARALDSMAAQTLPPDEIVLVCDGPLGEELEGVIAAFEKARPGLLRAERLPESVGVGAACNHGLSCCRNDLVARMDADDISEPDRCMTELAEFAADPSLDIVSGYILEFESDESKGFLRTVPTEREEVLRYARRRMPFSNVTIVYRRSLVQACGGYRQLTRAEDYDLVCRMLQAGARFKTLPKLLVRVRVNADAFRRRKSWQHTKSLIGVRWGLYRMGFTSLWDFAVMSCSHLGSMLLPERLIRRIYEKRLRVEYSPEEQ